MMIKIGVVNIDVSHPLAFYDEIKKDMRAQYYGVFNDGFRTDEEVEGFIKKCNVKKRYRNLSMMAADVDVGFVQGCNWDRHIEYAMPFINEGKPVFIDKPVVGNLEDLNKLAELVKNGAVILGSSSARYSASIGNFLSIAEEERGKIVSVFGTSGVDEFNYGIHIVEAVGGLMGMGAVSSRYAGSASVDGKLCETFFVSFCDGRSAVYNTFSGTFHPFEMVVMTTKGTYTFNLKTPGVTNYKYLLDRIFNYIETGENTLAGIDEISESIKIMLAGKQSKLNGGKTVRLDEISNDIRYDGNVFEKEYAKTAKNLYL